MAIKITSNDTHADGTLMVPNKLGIGTGTPNVKLHLYESASTANFLRLENSVGSTFLGTNTDGTSELSASVASGVLKFMTGGGVERMRITSSGNVGIGTSNPSFPLDVQYSVAGNSVAQIYNGTANAVSQALFVAKTSGSAGVQIGQTYGASGGSAFLNNLDNAALWFGTNNTERMRITSSGNVGIGTSSPAVRLHVADNVSGGMARGILENTASSGFTDLLIKSLGATYSSLSMAGNYNYIFFTDSAQSTERARITSDSTGNLGFATGASATERMRITSSGNVGIGGSPGGFYKLEVGGNVFAAQSPSTEITVQSQSSHAYFIADCGSTSNANLIFRRATVTKWYIINDGTTDRLYITDANSNDGVYIAQNTQSWSSNSDSRLKDVQGTITDSLAKVSQLTGVKFKWKRDAENPDAKIRVGLIAQDVLAVLPEAVDDDSPELITDEETGRVSGGLGVRYTEVIPLLVNAIKELTARVVTLEQAVA